jgi:hypothetical protein
MASGTDNARIAVVHRRRTGLVRNAGAGVLPDAVPADAAAAEPANAGDGAFTRSAEMAVFRNSSPVIELRSTATVTPCTGKSTRSDITRTR